MLYDLAHRHDLMLGQRILRANHQHQLVAKNRLDLQAGRLNRQRQNAHFHRAVFQLFHDLVAEISIDADLHRRIAPAVFRKNLRQHIQTGSLVRSNAQGAAGRGAVVRDRRERLIPQILKALGVFIENLSGGRQLHSFAGPVQQAVTVFLLKLADLRADRRL